MAPGAFPALAADVDAVAQVPVEALTVSQLMALVEQTAPVVSRLQGVLAHAVGELQARTGGLVPAVDGSSVPLPAWLRDVAQVSGREAGRQVRTATALRELPAVVDAVLDGRITPEHGRVLGRLVGLIEQQALLDSQDALLKVASRTDPEQLAQYVRHQIATWCPPELERQEADAVEGRFLQLTRKHDGRTRGVFELPDADAELMLTVLEPLARRDGLDDARSAGMRRVDALMDVVGLAARHGELPDAGGSRPRVTYVVPVDAQPAGSDPDRLPPCPAGSWTGPATRATVEQMLCDARIEVLTVDSDLRVLDLVQLADDPTAAQRRAVAARDCYCVAKGCTRPPAFCDLHHLRARADGGTNELTNLVLLCRRHHRMWHQHTIGISDLRVPWMRLPQPRAP